MSESKGWGVCLYMRVCACKLVSKSVCRGKNVGFVMMLVDLRDKSVFTDEVCSR